MHIYQARVCRGLFYSHANSATRCFQQSHDGHRTPRSWHHFKRPCAWFVILCTKGTVWPLRHSDTSTQQAQMFYSALILGRTTDWESFGQGSLFWWFSERSFAKMYVCKICNELSSCHSHPLGCFKGLNFFHCGPGLNCFFSYCSPSPGHWKNCSGVTVFLINQWEGQTQQELHFSAYCGLNSHFCLFSCILLWFCQIV